MDDAIAILLFAGRLEDSALAAHAAALMEIPRIVALEPPLARIPPLMRDHMSAGQARRLRFPGWPRLLVLYHPAQYPLARALCDRHGDLELWYVPPPGAAQESECRALDSLARGRAIQVLSVTAGNDVEDRALRERLRELEVITPRTFAPAGGRRRAIGRRRRERVD